jgi:hypothetical protein
MGRELSGGLTADVASVLVAASAYVVMSSPGIEGRRPETPGFASALPASVPTFRSEDGKISPERPGANAWRSRTEVSTAD